MNAPVSAPFMTVEELIHRLMELPDDLEVIAYVDWSGPIRSVYIEVTGNSERVILSED